MKRWLADASPRHPHRRHGETHQTARFGWLRAAVLGANDGIVSTASLVLGVASAHGSHQSVMIAGVSGLVAGAMSMAAGEYVSVHSQADSEKAELDRERRELKEDTAAEHRELAAIYVKRGLDKGLAVTVADQLMAHDGHQSIVILGQQGFVAHAAKKRADDGFAGRRLAQELAMRKRAGQQGTTFARGDKKPESFRELSEGVFVIHQVHGDGG